MEEHATPIEALAQKAETYLKTNVELLKLQSVDKVSDIVSVITIKIVFVLLLVMIAMMVNFGLAFWLGDILGRACYGFFAVAFFYIILTMIVYFCKKDLIGKPVKNAVIKEILDEKSIQP